MKKKFKLEFSIPVVKDRKTKNGKILIERANVKGMLQLIKRCFKTEDQRKLLDSYAEYYLFDKAGVEVYPLEK